jgi:two-component system NtrC family response regulator
VRILIIDDEILVARLLADAVSSQGHEVTVATDGEEGLALLGQIRPDALFLDVKLGELSGIEVLRQLRRSDTALPVILITGNAVADQLDEARRLGVTEIIEKPFLLTQLDGALERSMGTPDRG